MRKTLEERFWEKVKKAGPDECWLWTASCFVRDGYGQFALNGTKKRAHRLSFELSIGAIPEGFYVLHKCDVPHCVNPTHLFLGTQQDNMDDQGRKDRRVKGEKHGRVKLTEDQVRRIRALRETGATLEEIAHKFNVSFSNIGKIIRREKWKHVK